MLTSRHLRATTRGAAKNRGESWSECPNLAVSRTVVHLQRFADDSLGANEAHGARHETFVPRIPATPTVKEKISSLMPFLGAPQGKRNYTTL